MASITNSFAIKWLILLLFFNSAAMADRIVLKDGTIEVSDRIWESENYIHFILKGTRTVEIRYAKDIVERIERKEPADPSNIKPPGAQSQAHRMQTKENVLMVVKQPPSGGEPQSLSENEKPLDRQIARDNRGVRFYDPRRPERYWATCKMRFSTLKAVLEAIAKVYDRSSQWVEMHMGEENDLGVIHTNLIQQRQREETGSSGQKVPAPKVAERANMNPAEDIEPSAQIISESKKKAKVERPAISNGVRFYDPRRAKKYWSSETAHHSTLKGAINDLANQYGVSAEWIERHLGDSNDLAEIHHAIQKSIVSEK